MTQDSRHELIAARAAEVFLRRHISKVQSLAVIRSDEEWLNEDPEHRRALSECEAVWNISGAGQPRLPSASELDQDDYDAKLSVGEWNDRAQRRGAGMRRGRALAAAALLLICAGAAFWWQRAAIRSGEALVAAEYVTTRGEVRSVTLPDGSEVTLAPDSSISLRFGATREVHLGRGRALFQVAHDSARPFQVTAGAGVIRDVGTRFDVRQGSGGVTVTVAEGVVDVSLAGPEGTRAATRLGPDQQVTLTDHVSTVTRVNATVETEWVSGLLAYIDKPLEEIVADLRRYDSRLIYIDTPAVGHLRYTGTVAVDRIDQWARSLEKMYPLQVSFETGELRILSRGGAPK